ncbi:MAG TPA: DUF3419 domain-containing protein [Blastocatellia bacterium]|nr:DUF3419 domain-containing protein [Blastocatellia bacterium]
MTLETQWDAGRFGKGRGPRRILFGRMYEDVEIERAAFIGAKRIFCIASAGCTAIALAQDRDVVACDINPVQLAYAERRINGGEIELGSAERIMNFGRRFARLVGWRPSIVRDFLALSDPAEQVIFWRERLDTRRFRTAFDAMLSFTSLRAVYAPRFLSFLPPKFGAVLRRRLERGFARHPNATNPYAHALLAGQTAGVLDVIHYQKYPHVPQAARTANVSPSLERLSAAVSRGAGSAGRGAFGPGAPGSIELVSSDAASYLESCPAGFFDGFTLSNILDGAEPSYRERLFAAVRRAGSEDAVVVLRSFAEAPSDLVINRAEEDRSMIWGIVDVHREHVRPIQDCKAR